ncbi:MAG TPA: TIGR00282 family metallophosphoesterase [Candidatus Saccharimonadales bacterium]|nr:TIGR00282 family metallophosphoesterase [Candidatus Saccharimonadales bacterium]
MNILYVGDIQADPGLKIVERVLPDLRVQHHVDLVIAQAENLSDGRGVRRHDFERILSAGVDFCTGGNWTLYREEIYPALADPGAPIIRPANYPAGTPGLGYKYVNTEKGKVLIISLLGSIVGKDANQPLDNPLQIIDRILIQESAVPRAATVVNFHGDYSSEKRIIGYYLDGKVGAVIGDHWHVPSADASVLPKGTAHISDVGMCGSLDSSLGIEFGGVIRRWHDNVKTRNVIETKGRMQFNAVLIETGANGHAKSIRLLQEVFS